MKTIIPLTCLILALAAFSVRAQTQTLVTTTNNNLSATITVSSNSYAVVKSVDVDDGGMLLLNIQGVTFQKNFSYANVTGLTVYGPATIQLEGTVGYPTYASIEVTPELQFFPANQTLTVGSNAGNVQVTMQTSTDLANWTTAVNGMVYTNTPDARFFRIQLQTGVPAP
jgi:hypothetical protein